MGHIRPQPQLTVMYRRIFAKGKATIAECIEICKQQRIGVNCAEGTYGPGGSVIGEEEYTDQHDYMYGLAFELVLGMAADVEPNWKPRCNPPVLIPVRDGLPPRTLEILDWWMTRDDRFDEAADSTDDGEEVYRHLYAVPWKFGPGQRSKYTTDLVNLPTVGEITL